MKKVLTIIMAFATICAMQAQEKVKTDKGDKSDFIYRGGKIGIGTNNPQQKLTIFDNRPIILLKSKADGNSAFAGIDIFDVNSKMGYLGFEAGRPMDLTLRNQKGGKVLIPKGAVGIGTNNTGVHKLAVEGSIGARRVKVQASGWSDFVFEDSYELPTLEEVYFHIKTKGHLKDIPSAKEVMKNGIDLGDMDARLLQKIEELTLYSIQLNEENKRLKQRLEKLEEILLTKAQQD